MAEVGHLGRRSSATSTPSTTGIDPAAAAVPPHGKSLPIDCLHRPGRKPGLRATSRVAAVQREGPAMMATTGRRPPRTSSLGCASCSPLAGCAARSRAETATSSSSAPSRLRACTAAQQADDVGSAPTELAQRPPIFGPLPHLPPPPARLPLPAYRSCLLRRRRRSAPLPAPPLPPPATPAPPPPPRRRAPALAIGVAARGSALVESSWLQQAAAASA